MVSLNDVAKAAHVSKMTVSRVLNHPVTHWKCGTIVILI